MDSALPQEVGALLGLGWFACATLLVAGFSLSAGVSHLLDWLYQKRENESLAFGLICLTVAGHAMALVCLNRSATVANYALALKIDLCLLFVAQPAFIWFVARHMRVQRRREVFAFAACFGLLFVLNLLSPNSLMASEVIRLLVRKFPGGEPYVYGVLDPSPWRLACLAATLTTYAYGISVIYQGRRNVDRGEALTMAVSLVCMFTTWLETILNDPPALWVVLLSHYAFLAFIVLMGSALASRYGRQAVMLAQTHEALQESEERFRMLVEKAPDGIAVYDPEAGGFVDANPNAAALLGCSRQFLLESGGRAAGKQTTATALPPVQRLRSLAPQVLAGEEQVFEEKFQNLEGRELVCEVHLVRLPSTERRLIRASFSNITERKEAEKKQADYQQQLRSLASELALTEDRERKRIAAYLHDEVAQELLAAQLKLGELAVAAEGEAAAKIGHLRDMLRRAVEDTYSVTFELSLPILSELGLLPAIEWLGERVCESAGLRFRVVDDGLPKPLSQDVRSVCFEVVRELLRNVVKHAKASRVTVSARAEPAHLCLTIEDNGIGFDTRAGAVAARKDGGFGMFSVRERLEYLHGTISVTSQRGSGTRITLCVPLNNPGMTGENARHEN